MHIALQGLFSYQDGVSIPGLIVQSVNTLLEIVETLQKAFGRVFKSEPFRSRFCVFAIGAARNAYTTGRSSLVALNFTKSTRLACRLPTMRNIG